jgi:DNA-3-methyladenine glycosylase
MTAAAARLSRRFYRRDAVTLARALLGRRLVRWLDGRRLAGRIVETEAYLGERDRAAHTYNGRRTLRNQSMWGPAGHAYVYFTYGMHHCVNVVADDPGVPTAVLIRALEPTEGAAIMRARRAGRVPIERLREIDLCSGPAKLTQALAIDRELDGADLVDGDRLWVEGRRGVAAGRIVAAPRVGVSYAGAWARTPLRFCLSGSRHVSAPPRDGVGPGSA